MKSIETYLDEVYNETDLDNFYRTYGVLSLEDSVTKKGREE